MMTQGRTAFLPVGARAPRFAASAGDQTFDVLIVGAGITGLTTARLLGSAGMRVAVVEARRVGGGVTAYSTGQLTSLVDAGYVGLESDFGAEGARFVAEITAGALTTVEEIVRADGIRCDLRRVPTLQYAELAEHVRDLEKEAAAATRAGLTVRMVDAAEIPFPTLGALRLDNQLDLDASAYVQGLARGLPTNVTVFEDTRVTSIEDGEPLEVHTEQGILRARFVVSATHVPGGRNTLHTKTAAYRSYVISARVEGGLPPGIFVDGLDPYHYLRDHGGLVVLGGEDHKAGQRPDGAAPFDALEVYLRERFKVTEIVDRWTSELYAPVDGLPYIGPIADGSKHLVATGYDGDGLLFGTIAGKILSGHILDRPVAHAELFRPSRVNLTAAAPTFVKEQVNVAFHLVGDRVASAPTSAEGVAPGAGAIVDLEGTRCAVFRDESGTVHVRSATCPHLGCVVQWNPEARTFDCPCHGGCFSPLGEVLGGPPASALKVL